jgi:hypothetical protein
VQFPQGGAGAAGGVCVQFLLTEKLLNRRA